MTEQDPTPQLQPAPRYLRDFGSGPHCDPTDPAIYLATEPSSREMSLVTAIDRRHGGEPTPIIHTAKIALRLQSAEEHLVAINGAINGLAEVADPRTHEALKAQVAEVHGVYSKVRKWLYGAITTAAVGLTPTAYRLIDRSETHGAEKQVMIDLAKDSTRHEEELQALRRQISELQLELARHSSRQMSPSGGAYLVPPSALTLGAAAPTAPTSKGTVP